MTNRIRANLQRLEDYLDDQSWWQHTYWPIYRFWYKYRPRQLYREAKYFIQRGRRGYSDRDLWNANHHIARTTLTFLDMGGMHGVPGSFSQDGEPWEKTLERWHKVESEIRWLMAEHLDDDVTRWEKWGAPEHRKRVERANRLFGKYWMTLWD